MKVHAIFGIAALSAALAAGASSPGIAAMDEPVKVDCTNPANKDKPACNPQNGRLSDDQIYETAYWNAKSGKYKEALAVAAEAQNKDDPRILRVTGFATRKLGDTDGAMPYYLKALSINPHDTRTRQYMGEALITKGDMAGARAQLAEIEKRCGTSCEDYTKLSTAIAEAS